MELRRHEPWKDSTHIVDMSAYQISSWNEWMNEWMNNSDSVEAELERMESTTDTAGQWACRSPESHLKYKCMNNIGM